MARQQAAQITPQQIQLPAMALEPALDPLSSLGVRRTQHTSGPSSATSRPATRPLVLRGVQAAPDRDLPAYVYDPQRQIATDPTGAPLVPNLKKDWTTIEGTHTNGDGGDNETYDWEEV